MWKLNFQVSGLPGDDAERRRRRNDDTSRGRNAMWLVAGLVIAYLIGGGARTSNGVAIVLPTNGTATLEPQVLVIGKLTGGQNDPVTLRVNGATLTVPSADGVFQTPVALIEGTNEIRASSGGVDSEPITIIRKPRPTLRIDTPPEVSQTQEPEIGVAGTVEHLDGDSIKLEVNGTPQDLRTSGGRFSTKVQLPLIGANTIRAVASGTDPVLVTVIRSEPNIPAIAITEPADGITTESASIVVKGTIVNSDASEITLLRNSIPTTVSVSKEGFVKQVDLVEGKNYFQALLGKAESRVVLVNRKLPARIEIHLDQKVYDYNLQSSSAYRSINILGTVENLDTQSVSIRVNNEPKATVSVSKRTFGYILTANIRTQYKVQAFWGETQSNVLTIGPTTLETEPKTPQQKKGARPDNLYKGAKKP